MIFDELVNAGRYAGLQPGIVRALELLMDGEVIQRPLGRHDVDGDRLFFMNQEYVTKRREEGVWEAHQRYIDVQYMDRGSELIGRAATSGMTASAPYNDEKDFELFEGLGDFFTLKAGTFAVLYPHDAHMPCIADGEQAGIRKVVFKVLV